MEYSISEVAEKMNVTIPTLRYYDNIGLLQNLKKNRAGNRVFTEEDIETIKHLKMVQNNMNISIH